MLKNRIAVLGILAGITSIVLFVMREDTGAAMVLINSRTPLFVFMAAISGGALFYVTRKKS